MNRPLHQFAAGLIVGAATVAILVGLSRCVSAAEPAVGWYTIVNTGSGAIWEVNTSTGEVRICLIDTRAEPPGLKPPICTAPTP